MPIDDFSAGDFRELFEFHVIGHFLTSKVIHFMSANVYALPVSLTDFLKFGSIADVEDIPYGFIRCEQGVLCNTGNVHHMSNDRPSVPNTSKERLSRMFKCGKLSLVCSLYSPTMQ